jgi:hypothetical protein
MRNKIYNALVILRKLFAYNLKVVFGSKFYLFVLSAFLFFIVFGTISALNSSSFNRDDVYGLLLFPALLLIFYPTVFGIQNDADLRTLEIIFGIPDYRYKVWMVRLVMVNIIVFILLFPLAYMAQVLLIDFGLFKMVTRLMVVVVFIGTLGFFLSTVVRNGNGAAVVMVVIGLFFLVMGNSLRESMWNIFLNPYLTFAGNKEILWNETILKNRVFMWSASAVFLLLGLINLQRREKMLQ